MRRRGSGALAALLAATWTAPARAEASYELRVTAEHAELDDRGGLVATGDVRASSGSLLLRAPRLEWDRGRSRAVLEGGIVAVDGLRVLAARRLVFDHGTLELEEARLRVKKGIDSGMLRGAAGGGDPAAAFGLGRDALAVRASRLERTGADEYRAEDLWLTTCGCAEACRPLLAVSASSATVRPGDSVLLRFPVFRVLDVPVLPVPFPVSFPLGERRSGVLFPRLAFSGPDGPTAELPFFLTLGDSADLTVRPRWYFGPGTPPADGRGLSGPGVEAELRWRPTLDATGSLRGTYFYDRQRPADGEVRASRGEMQIVAAQGLLGGRFAADLRAVSDSSYLYDTVAAPEVAFLPYLRSRAGWARSGPAGAAALEATVLQSLLGLRRPADSGFGSTAPLPRLTVRTARQAGSLLLDGSIEGALWTSFSGSGRLPGVEPRLTAAAALGQTLPVVSGRAGTLVLEAGERAEWLCPPGPGCAGAGGARAGAFAGAQASTRLARTFEGGWTHDVTPSVAVRGFASAGRPFRDRLFATGADAPLTPLDLAQPPGTAAQGLVRLSSSLSRGGFVMLSGYLEHHQYLSPLQPGQLALGLEQGFEKALGGARLSLGAQIDPGGAGLVSASGAWRAGVGPVSALVQGSWQRGSRSDRFAAGSDMLFAMPEALAGTVSDAPTVSGALGADWAVAGGLVLRGEARYVQTPGATADPWQFRLAARYDAGGCARLALDVVWLPGRAVPAVGFSFDLGEVDAAGLGAAPALEASPPP